MIDEGEVGEACLPGEGRSLATPQFAGDEGSADAHVRHCLQVSDDDELLAALADARLLVAVVAVLDEMDEETGADKKSSMAIVSMVNASGGTGLLAFSGVDSMAAWDASARPVPVSAKDAAGAALTDGAEALVIDVLGPHRRVIAGSHLNLLAQG